MANQYEDTNTEGAPAEPSSDGGVRSTWEESELRQLFREEATNIVNGAFNVLRSDVQKVQAVLPQLDEVLGKTERVESLMKRVLKGTMTEEDYANVEQADQLAVEQAKRERAEALAKALQDAASKNDGGFAMAWDQGLDSIAEHVEREGVAEDVAISLQPKTRLLPAAGDAFGIKAHLREWKKAISDYADQQAKEEEPKPEVITTRGSAASTSKAIRQQYAAGEIPFSQKVAAALKEL